LKKKKRKKRKLIQCGGYSSMAKKQRNKREVLWWACVFMAEFFGRAERDGPCVLAAELRGFFYCFSNKNGNW